MWALDQLAKQCKKLREFNGEGKGYHSEGNNKLTGTAIYMHRIVQAGERHRESIHNGFKTSRKYEPLWAPLPNDTSEFDLADAFVERHAADWRFWRSFARMTNTLPRAR